VSQAADVINFVKTHGSITTKQAMEELGCYRLSGRIYDIRQVGIEVNRDMIEVPNRNGGTSRVARYTIPNIPECFA
jgi:hypothetical protein